jgi:hypothetical protein
MWDVAMYNGETGSHAISAWLFLRLLAVVYFIAFVSLGLQIKGLIGETGILPARPFLLAHRNEGPSRFIRLPTLFWWRSTDRLLQGTCWAGAGFSILLAAGVLPVLMLLLLWFLYLSLYAVNRTFLSFQWDILLLETGFLAIFIAPWQLWTGFPPASAPSPVVTWLFYWLIFRLMFSSGYVKLRSGDSTWRRLTALNYHYETQPLPTWIGWYAHQCPAWFQRLSVLVMFVIELLVPFLVFTPLRDWAGLLFILFMALIALTGNYGFFNLLTAVLAVLLLGDEWWSPALSTLGLESGAPTDLHSNWPIWAVFPPALLILALTLHRFSRLLLWNIQLPWPAWFEKFTAHLEPFHLANNYGLFARMTTRRPEIIIEASRDGEQWEPCIYRWKPGNPTRPPRFVAPHQPRLDWQLWFAALRHYELNPWMHTFLRRLLQGSPEVIKLLKATPYDHPPTYVRAVLYDYHFTSRRERKETGAWWKRDRRGFYSPVLSLKDPPSRQPEPGRN